MGTDATPTEATSKIPAPNSAAANLSAGLKRDTPPAAASPEVAKKPEAEGAAKPQAGTEGANPSLTIPAVAKPADEEAGAMRKRLDELESLVQSRDKSRIAEDVTDSFIRDQHELLPRDMLRKFLPVTSDLKVLKAETTKLEGYFKQYVDHFVKTGRLQYVPLGGASGNSGFTPSSIGGGANLSKGNTANSNIAAGLMASRYADAAHVPGAFSPDNPPQNRG